ncbi:hypothetical protein LJC23_00605 [Desulfovibrio sp. OttesenSCG-928-I05]|nr:hypothetical protein [Desulfovibrio sp. OttesenSCG-928-I05]
MFKRFVVFFFIVATAPFIHPATSRAAEGAPVISLPEAGRVITLSAEGFLAGESVSMEVPMRTDGTDSVHFSIGRDSPNGTRILAIYGDRGETLGAMLPETLVGLDDYGEMEENAMISLGAYDLDGDGVSEVIIASTDGAALLGAAIFRYEAREHERFRITGMIEGQRQLAIEPDGAITAPFGSRGLFTRYRLAPDGTINQVE